MHQYNGCSAEVPVPLLVNIYSSSTSTAIRLLPPITQFYFCQAGQQNPQGLPISYQDLSESGNIVTTEQTVGISYLALWEYICHNRDFGLLGEELARVLAADFIDLHPTNLKCLICLHRPRTCSFVDCGHLLMCMDCQYLFTDCPLCGKKIKAFVPTGF